MSDEKGKVVTFTRFKEMPLPGMEVDESMPTSKEELAAFAATPPPPLGTMARAFYNHALSAELEREAYAKHVSTFFDMFPAGPPLSRWERFKNQLVRWLPRVHFGPCDHDDCY